MTKHSKGKKCVTLNVDKIGKPNRLPHFIRADTLSAKYYDGITDDLLTAGLGTTGLAGAAPVVTDTKDPAQLRRLAIYTNYRALIDIRVNGGYSRFYGPNVLNDGTVTTSEGKISGWEYIALIDNGCGRTVTVMVQIPDTFDINNPSIVAAATSAFRGIYGAAASGADWALKNGSAFVTHDKGAGTGYDDLEANLVNLINGVLVNADEAGDNSLFTARLTDAERTAYNALFPNRVAIKGYHSQVLPEKDWGLNLLQAIVFGFYILNDKFGIEGRCGKKIVLSKQNTIVMGTGISAGGETTAFAIGQDICHLIDGAAICEPNIQVRASQDLIIRQGNIEFPVYGKTLVDHTSYFNLFAPAASLDPRAAIGPYASNAAFGVPVAVATNRATELFAQGFLTSPTLAGQAAEALDKILNYGYLVESAPIIPTYLTNANAPLGIAGANESARASVVENLAGFSFANTDASGAVIPQNPVLAERLFGTSGGSVPMPGVNIVFNDSTTNAKFWKLATSPSSGLVDFSFDGFVNIRSLVEGVNVRTGTALGPVEQSQSDEIQKNLAEVVVNTNIKQLPVIITHGRADALVPVNHSSRPYFGTNQIEHPDFNLRYLEVVNAQHFESLIGALITAGGNTGYDQLYIPLFVYYLRSQNSMFAHLKSGAALPQSQVVRTTPRGTPGSIVPPPPLTAANIPPYSTVPAVGDAINMFGRVLQIPN